MSEALLELQNLVVLRHTEPTGLFGLWGARPIRALDGVNLALQRGETLAITGGSGGGKTTLAEAATLRRPLDRGRILVQGKEVTKLKGDERRKLQRRLQIIRQDARESLEMERTVRKQLQELLRQHSIPVDESRMAHALERVGLPSAFLDRIPQAMSGGEQQRVAIAKALLLNPLLVAADEPLSGVDPRLKEELMKLLEEAQRESNLGYLFISQDLPTIGRMADRVAVMHQGRLYESGPAERMLSDALHPYSRFFLGQDRNQSAPPEEDMAGRTIVGCPWAGECPLATERCRQESPALRPVGPAHAVACHEVG